jgi:hypothetical protein
MILINGKVNIQDYEELQGVIQSIKRFINQTVLFNIEVMKSEKAEIK